MSAARRSWIRGIEIYLGSANTAAAALHHLNSPTCLDSPRWFPVIATRRSWIRGIEIYLGSANTVASALHLSIKPPSRELAEVFPSPEPAAVNQPPLFLLRGLFSGLYRSRRRSNQRGRNFKHCRLHFPQAFLAKHPFTATAPRPSPSNAAGNSLRCRRRRGLHLP